jgi:hypothetical protein
MFVMENLRHKGYKKKKEDTLARNSDGKYRVVKAEVDDLDKGPIDGEYKWICVPLTDREKNILMRYLRAQNDKKKLLKSKSGKKTLEQTEQRYLNEIAGGKDIDGVHADYKMCHGRCQRVYIRSNPKEEAEPKRVETGEKWEDRHGIEHAETVRVRRRKFVPAGLYCFQCGYLTIDEEFRLLGIEERKAFLERNWASGPGDKIIQGRDNEGAWQKQFHYATV